MFLVFSTLVSQILMLNMMVTITGDTFNTLSPIKESVIMFSRMRLMFTNMYVRNWKIAELFNIDNKQFEYENYIYLVEPNLDEIHEISVNDQVSNLKESLDQRISQLEK